MASRHLISQRSTAHSHLPIASDVAVMGRRRRRCLLWFQVRAGGGRWYEISWDIDEPTTDQSNYPKQIPRSLLGQNFLPSFLYINIHQAYFKSHQRFDSYWSWWVITYACTWLVIHHPTHLLPPCQGTRQAPALFGFTNLNHLWKNNSVS